MSLTRLAGDTRGSTSVELAITVPLFMMLTFGIIEAGWMMWDLVGLQHGVEMAARCASVRTMQYDGTMTTCADVNTGVVNQSNVKSFASQQSYGVNPGTSTFTVSTPACGKQVSASYSFNFLTSYFFGLSSLTLNARSCYPS
jgi:Flp pilus assembly protein TadG